MYKHMYHLHIFKSPFRAKKKKFVSIQSLKQVKGVRELDSLEAELKDLSTLGGALDLLI